MFYHELNQMRVLVENNGIPIYSNAEVNRAIIYDQVDHMNWNRSEEDVANVSTTAQNLWSTG